MISVLMNQNEEARSKSVAKELKSLHCLHLTLQPSNVFTINSFISRCLLSITSSIWCHMRYSVCACVCAVGAEKKYPMTGRRTRDPAAAVQQPSPSGERSSRTPDTCTKGKRNTQILNKQKACFSCCTLHCASKTPS